MRITEVHLEGFKRFTDLTIRGLNPHTKLVLLIGSNGSGKSSIFDAFEWLNKNRRALPMFQGGTADEYYFKGAPENCRVSITFSDEQEIQKVGHQILTGNHLASRFIGRSSIRIVPKISNTARPNVMEQDEDSPLSFIENDDRFINDVYLYIQTINNAIRQPIFNGVKADTLEIFQKHINPLNESLINILGGDASTTIQIAQFQDATAQYPAKLLFKKGTSLINYDLLSHGEKQVVILLLNLIVRTTTYQDVILSIDEMDNHLNTALQHSLISEIVEKWLPDGCQLWTASHALGFIDFAKNYPHAEIIDLDLLDFDQPQILIPSQKSGLEVYEIAIPKLTIAKILTDHKLVVVENQNDEYFNSALGPNGYLFLPANNNREVFYSIKEDPSKLGLRDKDYLRQDEVLSIQKSFPGLKILPFYNFENLIYHPDNLEELVLPDFSKDDYIAEIRRQKDSKLLQIVGEIGTSRQHYAEFKDGIKNDLQIQAIIDALKSEEFNHFYPFFNMKNHFTKEILQKYDLPIAKLCDTKFFKSTILQLLTE